MPQSHEQRASGNTTLQALTTLGTLSDPADKGSIALLLLLEHKPGGCMRRKNPEYVDGKVKFYLKVHDNHALPDR
jgi:hypothetical protein